MSASGEPVSQIRKLHMLSPWESSVLKYSKAGTPMMGTFTIRIGNDVQRSYLKLRWESVASYPAPTKLGSKVI